MFSTIQIFKNKTTAGDSAFFNAYEIPNVNYDPKTGLGGGFRTPSLFRDCRANFDFFAFYAEGSLGTTPATVKIYISGNPNPDPTQVQFVDSGITIAIGMSALKQMRFTWLKATLSNPVADTN